VGKVDLCPLFPPIRDQGQRGTCVAFSVTAAHEVALLDKTGNLEDLSEETLYWHCKQNDGDNDPGTSFDSAALALSQSGQPTEDKWPYDGFRDDTAANYLPPQAALDPNVCHKAQMKQVAPTIGEIRRLLEESHPVALGIPINDTFLLAPSGRIPLPAPNDNFTDGHAILIVGYDDGNAPDEGVFLFRNSWGDGWGEQGYGYLPYAYVQQYGIDAWIVE
jgi:C1A family cysteine protease